MQGGRIVRFFWQWLRLHDLTFREYICKCLIQRIGQTRRRGMVETNHQVPLHKAIGVKVAVKGLDLADRRVDVVHDLKKAKLPSGNIAPTQHCLPHEPFPLLPILSVRKIHENNRHNLALASLSQSQRLAELVVGAKSAREYNNRIRFLYKHELAGKEEMKAHEL